MTAPTQATAREAVERIQAALKNGPTEGPWLWSKRADDELSPASVFAMPREGHAYAVFMCPRYGIEDFPQNAEYAIAVQPSNIRALLALLAAKQEELDKMRELLRDFVTNLEDDHGGDHFEVECPLCHAVEDARAALSPSQQGN